VLQVFDKLAHDSERRRLIFDLDRDLAAHKVDSAKMGPITPSSADPGTVRRTGHSSFLPACADSLP
jgi:hypothetical protein